MENNESRGKRTLWWMKAAFVTSILAGISVFCTMNLIPWNSMADSEQVSSGMVLNTWFWIAAVLLTSVLAFVSYSVCSLFWLMWMYRAIKNLRRVTTTVFGPWISVILCSIPYVGFLIHFFVFREMVKKTESVLGGYREAPSKTAAEILVCTRPVDMNFVKGFFIMAILAGGIGFVRDTFLSGFLSLLFSIAAFACYYKSFAALVKEETALFEIYQDDQLRKKVDQVLWERELEKNDAECEGHES